MHKKVIKSAGLNFTTPSTDLYKVSTKISFQQIIKKQILLLGLKNISIDNIIKKRFRIQLSSEEVNKPFIKLFAQYFNELPLDIKKQIIYDIRDNCDPKRKYIKMILKRHFITKCNGNKKMTSTGYSNHIRQIILKNMYTKNMYPTKNIIHNNSNETNTDIDVHKIAEKRNSTEILSNSHRKKRKIKI